MAKLVPTVGPYETPPLKGVAWGAIFGGTFISLAIMLLLGSLGLAIGATSIDPMTGETPSLRAFSIGSGLWWLGSGIVGLFAGGWAASRLAGPRRRLESTLHGLITWAFTTATSVVLMGTVVGALASGAMRMIGTTSLYAAQNARAVASQLIPEARGTNELDVAWNEIWNEAQQLLRQTEQPGERRENVERTVRELGEALDQSPQAMLNELERVLSRFYRHARETISEVDRDSLIDVLVARTDMNRDQAHQVVNRWAERLQDASRAMYAARVQTAAVVAAEATANAVASAAWWTFFFLVLSGAGGGLGGLLGAFRRRQEGMASSEARISPP